MNEIDVIQSLRPEVAPLDPAAKADLRRSIFDAPVAGGDQPSAADDGGGADRVAKAASRRRLTERPRWVPAVAAAALAIAGTTGLWALTTRRSAQPSAQGEVAGKPAGVATAPLPDWHEPLRALLPPGFDYIAIMPAPQSEENGAPSDGELFEVVAVQPSSGLVLDLAIDTRIGRTEVVVEDDWFTDRWGAYLDNINATTLVTPDRRSVRVRCSVTLIDGHGDPSVSGVAESNDVCAAAGGPTVGDRRAIAARFADAVARGELVNLGSAASEATAPPTLVSDRLGTAAVDGGPNFTITDLAGRRESVKVPPVRAGGLSTEVGVLYGVQPIGGQSDPQVHKITLGVRSDRSQASYPEAPTVDRIATVTFLRGGVLYQAVTDDVSDSHLAGLKDLVRQLADSDGPISSITVPSVTVASVTVASVTVASTVPAPPTTTTPDTQTSSVQSTPPTTDIAVPATSDAVPATTSPPASTTVATDGVFPSCTNDPYVWLASTGAGYQESAEIVQRRLVALGYNVGEVNGFLHDDTIAALEQWAADNDYPANYDGGFPRTWFPDDGMVDTPVLQRLGIACDRAPSGCEFAMDRTKPLQYSEVGKRVQQRLAELGFAPGDIDGYFGPNSQAALDGWSRAGDKRVWEWTEGFDGFTITEKGWYELGLSCSS